MEKFVFTIGHSNHEPTYFLSLLQAHNVDCIVDVRSVPASARNPGFNQKPLEAFLRLYGIQYLHFPDGFGARQEAPALLDSEGRVDFDRVSQTPAFQESVRRLAVGVQKGFRVALMCSEADPLDCHRFSMISRVLVREGFAVWHILKDASLAEHSELEAALLEKFQKKLPRPTLFEPNVTEEQRLRHAYRLHNIEIGWSKEREQTTAIDEL